MRLRDVRPVENTSLTEGVLRRDALGSEAVYRVLRSWGSTVEVEVVSAPGLKPGARHHLTAAAASMGLDSADAGRRALRSRSAVRGARFAARGGREALGYLSRQVPRARGADRSRRVNRDWLRRVLRRRTGAAGPSPRRQRSRVLARSPRW